MKLYFSPMACSLAVRMALVRAGLQSETEFVRVDLASGGYRSINPKGQVPALLTRDGELLTENLAILLYVAELRPEAGLAPPDRLRLLEWLSYLASEVHKAVYYPIFHPRSTAESTTFARQLAPSRFQFLENHLSRQPALLSNSEFSVADAYLLTTLQWVEAAGLSLSEYPHLKAYRSRLQKLPWVAEALQAERPLVSA